MKCNQEGSGCISLRGAGVKQGMQKVVETARTMDDNGLLILQGGGNGLHRLKAEECIVDYVKASSRLRIESR